jgi:hypothetical protein
MQFSHSRLLPECAVCLRDYVPVKFTISSRR